MSTLSIYSTMTSVYCKLHNVDLHHVLNAWRATSWELLSFFKLIRADGFWYTWHIFDLTIDCNSVILWRKWFQEHKFVLFVVETTTKKRNDMMWPQNVVDFPTNRIKIAQKRLKKRIHSLKSQFFQIVSIRSDWEQKFQ